MSGSLTPWLARAAVEHSRTHGTDLKPFKAGKRILGKLQLLRVISSRAEQSADGCVWAEFGDKDLWVHARIAGDVVRNFDFSRSSDAHLLTLAHQIFTVQDMSWTVAAPLPALGPPHAEQLCIDLHAFKHLGGGEGGIVSQHTDGKLHELRRARGHPGLVEWVDEVEMSAGVPRRAVKVEQGRWGQSPVIANSTAVNGAVRSATPVRRTPNPYSRPGPYAHKPRLTATPPPPPKAVYVSPFEPDMLDTSSLCEGRYPSDDFLARLPHLKMLDVVPIEPARGSLPPAAVRHVDPSPPAEETDEVDELDESQHIPTPRIETQQVHSRPAPRFSAHTQAHLSSPRPSVPLSSAASPVAGQAQHRQSGMPTEWGSPAETTQRSELSFVPVLSNVEGMPMGGQSAREEEEVADESEPVEESMDERASQAEDEREDEDERQIDTDVEMEDVAAVDQPVPEPARPSPARPVVPSQVNGATSPKAVQPTRDVTTAQPRPRKRPTLDSLLKAKGVVSLSWIESAKADGTGLERVVERFLKAAERVPGL